jgi:hypothetical protein
VICLANFIWHESHIFADNDALAQRNCSRSPVMLSPFVLRRQNQLFHARAQLFIFYLMARRCNKTFSSECQVFGCSLEYEIWIWRHTHGPCEIIQHQHSRPNFVAIWTREASKIDGWIVWASCAHSLVYHNPAPGVFDRACLRFSTYGF